MSRPELSRVLGPVTTVLVGLGVAIGSGILRTPPLVAQELGHAPLVLLAWGLGGLALFASSLVMAELATRIPRSGGEYAWLREAFGPFAAYFFGWGYTLFMVAGGAATTAAAFGDAARELLGGDSRMFAAAAIAVVAAANMVGLRTGAALQNLLTVVKLGIVLAIAAVAAGLGPAPEPVEPRALPGAGAWVAALPAVIWAYAGSTDAVKLSGEVKDPSRRLPASLFLAIAVLTAVYVVVNGAFLYGLGVEGLAGSTLPAAEVARRAFGRTGETYFAAASAVVFLGGLSSTLLATVRVAWALGQDGRGLGLLGRMNQGQAPVYAIGFVAAVAILFALNRDFEEILGIYFFAGAILFGLVYASLLVFRRRDQGAMPPGVFRCPGAPVIVAALLLVQGAMAVLIATESPGDALATVLVLAAVAAAYRLSARFSA